MNQSEYDTLKRQIESEYRQNLDALDRVWKMSQRLSQESPQEGVVTSARVRMPVDRLPSVVAKRKQRSDESITSKVETIVRELTGPYTWRDIQAKLKKEYPSADEVKRTTLAQILRGLRAEGAIDVVIEGKGRRPAQYTTKKPEVSQLL